MGGSCCTIAGAVAFFPVDGAGRELLALRAAPGAIAIVLARAGVDRLRSSVGVALGMAVLCRQTWIIGIVGGAAGAAVARAATARRARGSRSAPRPRSRARRSFVPFGGFWHWTFTGNGGFLQRRRGARQGRRRLPREPRDVRRLHVTLVVAVVVAAIAFAAVTRQRGSSKSISGCGSPARSSPSAAAHGQISLVLLGGSGPTG